MGKLELCMQFYSKCKMILCFLPGPVFSVHCFQTSRGEFDSCEYEVRRRYQDFLWLKSKLEEAHPTLIIPVRLLKLMFFLLICVLAPALYNDV